MKRICLLFIFFAIAVSVVARPKVYVDYQVLVLKNGMGTYEKKMTFMIKHIVEKNLMDFDLFDISSTPREADIFIFFSYMEGPYSVNPVFSVRIEHKLKISDFEAINKFDFSKKEKTHIQRLINEYLIGDNMYSTLLGSCAKKDLRDCISKMIKSLKVFLIP